MLDELVARARHEPGVPWNDLRERRLLTGALELARRKGGRRAVLRRVSLVGSLAVLLALVVLAVVRPSPSPAPATANRLPLPGGATAEVSAGAEVRVREVVRDRVRVLQSRGRVSYEVTRDPDRRFEVEVADVRVIVRGTRFSVAVDESWVRVAVVTGRVEVHDGLRSTMLTDGEEIRVRGYVARSSEPAPAPSAAPAPSVSAPSVPRALPETAQSLLDLADAARRAGRSADAAAALRTLVTRYPSDPRAAAAWFTLGRIESGRGNAAGAADAFAHCRRVGRGLLAEDALAEEAASRGSAALAREYLAEYPNGTHQKRMQAIVATTRRASENR
jgi:hypothetical protein